RQPSYRDNLDPWLTRRGYQNISHVQPTLSCVPFHGGSQAFRGYVKPCPRMIHDLKKLVQAYQRPPSVVGSGAPRIGSPTPSGRAVPVVSRKYTVSTPLPPLPLV